MFIDFFNVRDLLLVIDVLFVLKGKVEVEEIIYIIYNNYDDTNGIKIVIVIKIKIMIVVIVLIILIHYARGSYFF